MAQSEVSQVDMDDERGSLLEADRAMYKAFTESPDPVEGLLAFFTEDAAFLAPEASMVVGKENIRSFVSEYVSVPGFSIRWTPTKVDVSKAGDLGYTIGTEEITVNDSNGNPVTTESKYLTIWKREGGSQWMVVADMFSPNTPPPAGEE